MGRAGDCYDSAMCESFFGTLECGLPDRFGFQHAGHARAVIFV
jgi:transposase InsO family protein